MKNLIIGAFQLLNPNGTIGSSWRAPGNTATRFLTLDYWTSLARQLEDGGFDFLFFADSYGYPTIGDEVIPTALTDAMYVPMGDPITVVSALAAVTHSLGFVVTSSTTVEKPAAIARRYGTIDHFTDGRVGWNVVTGAAQSSAAELFGERMMKHDARYEQADDHVSICLKLWEGSWADDALKEDRAGQVYADPARVRRISHTGPHLSAKGIYNLPPSPQRTPLVLQAGTSLKGRDFAARYAEVIFLGGAESTQIAEQIADIRGRAAIHGRARTDIRFVVGAHFVTATTTAEAVRKRNEMLEYATLEQAATTYAWVTGIDLTRFALDEPIPDLYTEQGQTSIDRFMEAAITERKTVREVLEEYRSNGLNGTMFIGNPRTVASQMADFIELTGADGFLVQPHLTPGTYDDFIAHIVPELRRLGMLAEKPGSTFRGRLFPEHGDRLPAGHPGAAYRFEPAHPQTVLN